MGYYSKLHFKSTERIKPLAEKNLLRRWLRKLFGRSPRRLRDIDEMHELRASIDFTGITSKKLRKD